MVAKLVFSVVLFLLAFSPVAIDLVQQSDGLDDGTLSVLMGAQLPCGTCVEYNDNVTCFSPYPNKTPQSECDLWACTETSPAECGVGRYWSEYVVQRIGWEQDPGEDYYYETSTQGHDCYFDIVCNEGAFDATKDCERGRWIPAVPTEEGGGVTIFEIGECFTPDPGPPDGCTVCSSQDAHIAVPPNLVTESDRSCIDCQ